MSATRANYPATRPPAPTVSRSPGLAFRCFKRTLDVAGATIGLALLSPLLLLCALWIMVVDGGPVLYRQWRVGHNGWVFRIYKLRTMSLNAEQSGTAQFASRRDPRVLRGCQWMRKSHADELPQLWNVLIGDMSLVGPRPERPEILDWLSDSMPRIDRRLQARPGITGLAQLRNGYTNDLDGARRKVANDLRYLRAPSIASEIKLLLGTIPKVWDEAAL